MINSASDQECTFRNFRAEGWILSVWIVGCLTILRRYKRIGEQDMLSSSMPIGKLGTREIESCPAFMIRRIAVRDI